MISPIVAELDAGPVECYVSGESWVGCMFGEYMGPLGAELFGLLVGGTIIFAMYLASDGDLVVPSVVMTLFGGILIPILPASQAGFGYVIMLLGLIGSVFAIGMRYFVRGGL